MPCGSIRLKQTASEIFGSDGSRAMTGDFDGGSNKLTNIAAGTAATDGVNKQQMDDAIALGAAWTKETSFADYIGNLGELALEALSPEENDLYVVSAVDGDATLNPGGLAIAVGDGVRWSGGVWTAAWTNVGGFPPDEMRVLVSARSTTVAVAPAAGQDNDWAEWDGTSLTPAFTSPTNGQVTTIVDTSDDFENYALNYDSTPGEWNIQSSGAFPTAGNGLVDSSGVRSVQPDSTTGGNVVPVDVTSNGVGLDVDDIDGVGIEASGSGTLDISAQGNGLTGGGGTVLSVEADATTGGNVVPVNVVANGVGLDVSTIVGTGVEADGSGNIRIAAQGNGITGGSGTTLSVQPDSTTGGNVVPVNVVANGVGLDLDTIDGNGLTATSGALAVQPDSTTGGDVVPVSVGANGVGLDVSSIDGDGLLADGSGLLDVQPDSTTGGNVKPVSVGANGVGFDISTIDGAGLSASGGELVVAPADLISGGAAEIDGDQLDIDWNPSNYTPTTSPTEVTSLDHLTAHLAGIDSALGTAGGTPQLDVLAGQVITGTDTALAATLSATPSDVTKVRLYMNGVLMKYGAGNDYTVSGTTVTILASSGTACDVDGSDEFIASYES